MPGAIQYFPPNDRRNRVELGGDDERGARNRIYEKNLKQYNGDHRKYLYNDPDDPVDDNVIVNVTKQAVDRVISFLFPALPIFQLNPDQETPDETWLNDSWKVNGGAYTLGIIGQNGAISGHNYVKVIADTPYPRMIPLNPMVPITFWKSDDFGTVLWHELRWSVGRQEMLQDYVNNQDGTWTIYEYVKVKTRVTWNPVGETQWEYDVPPIIAWPHLPNAQGYYGIPEITPNTIALNNSINRTASDISKILRYHASPRTIVIGATLGQIQPAGINGVWVIDDKDAKVENLEMRSDLTSSLNYLTFLNEAYLSVSRVVIMKGTVKDFQRVTNTGIRAVFLDMIAKNQTLRWTYGIGLQKISLAMMYLGKKTTAKVPEVTWTDPLPADPLENVNSLAIQQANGWIDPETASKSLGYEWETVVSNWKLASNYTFVKQLILKTPPVPPPGSPAAAQSGNRLAKTSNSNSSLNDQNINK